jgi:hypothetical protein
VEIKNSNKSTTRRDGVIESYLRLLANYKWDWIVTLKPTRGAPSIRRGRQLLNAWLAALRRAEGAEDFKYFWVLERGEEDAEICFYLLIGGLRNRVWVWGQKWEDRAGDATIMPFDPNSNDILSMLKSTTRNRDIIFDYDLADEKPSSTFVRPSLWATLRVRGIDGQTTIPELEQLFEKFGRIRDVAIGGSRLDADRFVISGSITMDDFNQALDAEEKMNGYELRGTPIRVSIMRRDDAE